VAARARRCAAGGTHPPLTSCALLRSRHLAACASLAACRRRHRVLAAMDSAPAGAADAAQEPPYRVAVVGAGGVGAYFAARLAQAGACVHCVCRGAHAESIRLRGIRVTSIAGDATVRRRRGTRAHAGAARSADAVVARPAALRARCAWPAAPRTPRSSGTWTWSSWRSRRGSCATWTYARWCALAPCSLVRRSMLRGPPRPRLAPPRARAAPRAHAHAPCPRRRGCAAPPALTRRAVLLPALRPRQVGARTLVMPTQNGVDAPETLAALLGAAHVLGGYTRITSLLTGAGAVSHTAIHPAVQGTGALPSCAAWVPDQLRRCAAAWAVRNTARRAHATRARACARVPRRPPRLAPLTRTCHTPRAHPAAAALAAPAPGGGG
jgi:hypothetical protein